MVRLGVDFGGTKIEAAALDSSGAILSRERRPNPGSYAEALLTVRDLVETVAKASQAGDAPVGVGMPGSLSARTGLVRNANSVWLNGAPFDRDLEQTLGRRVRLHNDANCFALSEAVDGAGAGAEVVFGAILGTGCGGGVVVRGTLVEGVNKIAGEWGHTPLPWPKPDEDRALKCWCGRINCLETWISGSGFEADHARTSGETLTGESIVARARAGDPTAQATVARYADRLGRALAVVCDILDPDVIVCGGGMSNIPEIYAPARETLSRLAFSDSFATRLLQAQHGDSSGVRGAAWLWPET
ncbi:MAG: ROK family protein [Alphaproteobacteria bacterium]|nr:ROK family protein [Alphaproteobacteria bacterium]